MNIVKLIVPILLSAALLTSCGKSDGSSKTEENVSAAQASSSQAEVQYPRSIKLMAFGDSITEGFTYKGSYRVPLANMLEENGLSQYVDFVGKRKPENATIISTAAIQAILSTRSPSRLREM